jgi:hypothetical protein
MMQTAESHTRRAPRAAVPAFVAAVIGGAPVVFYLVLSHGHDMSSNSPRENFWWALVEMLAVATLAGAVFSAAGRRLGQPLLYGAAAAYFMLGAMVLLTGWVFFPAGVLAVAGAGKPRVPPAVIAASVAIPLAVILVGMANTG